MPQLFLSFAPEPTGPPPSARRSDERELSRMLNLEIGMKQGFSKILKNNAVEKSYSLLSNTIQQALGICLQLYICHMMGFDELL